MNLRRPLSRRARGRPPGVGAAGESHSEAPQVHRPWTRIAPPLSLLVGLSVCALAGSALFVPGFVLGAEGVPDLNTGSSAVASSESPRGAVSQGALLVALPWGSGAGQVGLEQPLDGLTRGPEALAVAPDGRIAVLDSVNKRVVFLDAGGGWIGAASVPLAEPRFLAVDDDQLYVLDCDADRVLSTLDWDGTVLGMMALPELTDVVTGLFATERGPCVEVAHDGVFLLSGTDESATSKAVDAGTATVASRLLSGKASLRPLAGRPAGRALGRATKVTFAPAVGLRIQSFQVDRSSLKAKKTADSSPVLAPGRTVEHLVSVDSDAHDGLVVGVRLLNPEPAGDGQGIDNKRACLLLTRLVSIGRGLGAADTLLLAESTFAYLGQPYVVDPNGRVLQPVADESGYSVLVHSFAQTETPVVAEEVLP